MYFPSEALYFAIGAVILGIALLWGYLQYRARNRANDRITEQATRESYQHPEDYERRREELNKEIRPS